MTAQRTDNRGQWTIKHADVGPEFQNLVRMAAERQGMTVGSFVVETLRERATAILKGDGAGTPRSTPPARIEDVADIVTEAVKRIAEEMRREQTETLEAVRQQGEVFERRAQEQAEALATMQRQARRGRWR